MLAVPLKLFEAFARLLEIVGQGVLAFMALTITYDATMRYLFAAPTSWSLEINSFLVVYLAVMTAAEVQRRGEHIGITLLADSLSPGGKRAVTTVVGIVGAVFCAIITWRGGLMAYDAWAYGERVSSAFGTPMWLAYAMLPIGFGTLGLQFLINIVRGPSPAPSETMPHV